MRQTGLTRALQYFRSQKDMAKALGVSQQTINHWLNRDEKIPALRAMQLFVHTKGAIPLQELTTESGLLHKLLEQAHVYLNFPAVSMPIEAIRGQDFVCPNYKEEDGSRLDDARLSLPLLVDTNKLLIACTCRLQANRWLGRKTVFVNTINLREVIQGKLSLAPLINAFPISERVMIGLAIERELGSRQGKRKDLQLLDNYPEVSKGEWSRKIASKIAGFNSDFSYRQAKQVVQHGSSQLIQCMDKKWLSLHKASHMAHLPEKEQHTLLNTFYKKTH